MHACDGMYLHWHRGETRHGHRNVFDEWAIMRVRGAWHGHAHPHTACLHTRRGEASDQALPASPAHRPLEAWEALAGCIPARSSRPPEATHTHHHHHRCSRRLCSTTLRSSNGRVDDVHSFFGIDRIHSFIPHSHFLSLARVYSATSLLNRPIHAVCITRPPLKRRQTPPSPSRQTHASHLGFDTTPLALGLAPTDPSQLDLVVAHLVTVRGRVASNQST